MSENNDKIVDNATNLVVGAVAVGMGIVVLSAFMGLAVLVFRAIT